VSDARPTHEPLVLIERRRDEAESAGLWLPFSANGDFEYSHWWDDVSIITDAFAYFEVRRDGVEVARVQLNDDLHGGDYVDLRGQAVLQVDLIEVALPYRREGVATQTIRLITEVYPDHRFAALSEDADPFWASLGWRRFDNQREPMSRPLYLQPVRSAAR